MKSSFLSFFKSLKENCIAGDLTSLSLGYFFQFSVQLFIVMYSGFSHKNWPVYCDAMSLSFNVYYLFTDIVMACLVQFFLMLIAFLQLLMSQFLLGRFLPMSIAFSQLRC